MEVSSSIYNSWDNKNGGLVGCKLSALLARLEVQSWLLKHPANSLGLKKKILVNI